MSDYVFLGPSLSAAEASALLPGVTVLPPIEHGDLLRLDPAPGDRVLIVDGLFMRKAPVRHREILHYLQRGVTVAGSSSMGALRAAELWQYGMRGIGTVFELYRDGVITDDDEVAVVHGPADEGHRTLSEPLVNLRVALDRAVRDAAVTRAEADRLLGIVRALPFRARGLRALRRAAPADAAVDRLTAWLADHPTEVKSEDARLLLRLAAEDAPQLCPRTGDDTPIEYVHTYLMEAWLARHQGGTVGGRLVGDALTVATIMVLHPDFPALHAERVLAGLVSAPAGTGPAAVREQAVDLARRRGLLPAGDESAIYDTPVLTPADRALSPADAALRALVRIFGPADCRTVSLRCLPEPLRRPEVIDAARSFVDSARRLNDKLPHPDPHRPHLRMTFRHEVVDRMLCGLWDCSAEQLPTVALDHGFEYLDRLRATVEPLTAWLKICGPPRFPAAAELVAA